MLRRPRATSRAPASMVFEKFKKFDIFRSKLGVAIPWAPKVIVGPRPLKSLVKASTCFVHCYHEVKLYRKIKLNPPLLVTMIYPIKQSALIFRTLIFSDNSKTIHPRTLKM